VVWNLSLQTGSEGPTLISRVVAHANSLHPLSPYSWRTFVGYSYPVRLLQGCPSRTSEHYVTGRYRMAIGSVLRSCVQCHDHSFESDQPVAGVYKLLDDAPIKRRINPET
jgi:hypothetical protein